ncbi:alcohol dehydrogenase catalytic domain-containing protein [Streptomyces fuscichromogenes]|uniref:NADPH:quinone reductase n=1 Tax=Streptomyces fuscichromogenes TaxID=1324013 RepID=A0A917XQX9_9ACTN|nr:alcohol dehydrogenase catalytic domain-containing protein [Streptomyces fuscichromogenes]GGN47140.1 NADPH:quinone reductase [Streptomyces fuscichromogenes]
MPKAITLTDFGGPDVLQWTDVPLPQPPEGHIRVKVKAAGVGPTDLALRSGRLKAFSLQPNAVLGFEVAGTVDAVGTGVTGTQVGEEVAALLFDLGGYAEYAVASMWVKKPPSVPWASAASLPASAEAAAGVLRKLGVKTGDTLLVLGGGGAVGLIAAQLAVAQGIKVVSAVGARDDALVTSLGATPVRYGAELVDAVRSVGTVDFAFDASGKGVLADAIALTGAPNRVITLSDPAAADFGVTLSPPPSPERAPHALEDTMPLLAQRQLRLREYRTMPMQAAGEAHRQLESGQVHERIVLTL